MYFSSLAVSILYVDSGEFAWAYMSIQNMNTALSGKAEYIHIVIKHCYTQLIVFKRIYLRYFQNKSPVEALWRMFV